MRLLAVLFLAVSLAARSRATSIVFPTFSTPILKDGTLVALSSERTRLVAFSIVGERRWEKPLEKKASLALHRAQQLLLVSGSTVSLLNAANGSTSPLFNFPQVDQIQYDEESDLFVGTPTDEAKHTLVAYLGENGKKLFSAEEGEALVYGDTSIAVVAGAVRKPVANGYTFTRSWLEAYRRSDGAKLWSVDFKQRLDPYHRSAKVGAWLVVEDGSEWMIVDSHSGEVLRHPVDRTGNELGPYGLKENEGRLMFVMGKMNIKDFSRSRHTVYTVSIPDFKTISHTEIEVIEAGEVENAGDFLVTDSLYRTACFRRDGTKVWEHFQMHRTPATDGIIYFSDYKEETARLGSIEIATGKETIFARESVSMKN